MNRRSKTILVEDIPVMVRKSRARCLRLTIGPGGEVRLSLPYFVSYKKGLSFLQEKRQWITRKRKELASAPVSFLRQGGREEFEECRDQALAVVTESLRKLQSRYGISPKRIVIRNQRTRWGSCSRTGTISFNYRLLLLPERLRDYVLAHELCHLREFNHARRFWELVEETFPDYRELRRELKNFRPERPEKGLSLFEAPL